MACVERLICWTAVVITLAGCAGSPAPTTQSGDKAAVSGVQVSSAKAPDENAALDAIAKVNGAQSTYFKLNRRYALTFDELIEAHLLKSEPTAAEAGYDFTLRPAADAQTYKLTAVPSTPSPTHRHFLTDQSGTVHAETGKDATLDSPKVG
jgi:hypothetical protein